MKLYTILGLAVGFTAVASAQSPLERAAAKVLADRYRVSEREVLENRRRTGLDIWELGPMYEYGRQNRMDPYEVARQRRQGLGWGQIAKINGMHPADLAKMRKSQDWGRRSNEYDRDRYWDGLYRDRYGSDWTNLRNRGLNIQDAFASLLIGGLAGRDPYSVYGRYRNDRDWDRTARGYGVDLASSMSRIRNGMLSGGRSDSRGRYDDRYDRNDRNDRRDDRGYRDRARERERERDRDRRGGYRNRDDD